MKDVNFLLCRITIQSASTALRGWRTQIIILEKGGLYLADREKLRHNDVEQVLRTVSKDDIFLPTAIIPSSIMHKTCKCLSQLNVL